MKTENIYCTIMAGGTGTRLWPLSQSQLPKQFIDLAGTGKTMIQLTYDRFRAVCAPERFVVVTLQEYRHLVRLQLPELPEENILCEPFKRNTSACIAYANAFVRQRSSEAVVIVTPSDHLIIDNNRFVDTVCRAADYVADKDILSAIGVHAFRPDTGFGYIQVGEELTEGINAVRTFTEKPNAEMAQTFYECGDFCWNSGVFVWRAETIATAMHKYLPALASQYEALLAMPISHWTAAAVRCIYEEVESISVDYGVMEKARNVVVAMTDAVWSDLGGYDAIYEQGHKDENANTVVCGTALMKNSHGCLVHLEDGYTCVVEGLDDYIVAERGRKLLICPRSSGMSAWQYKSELKAETE